MELFPLIKNHPFTSRHIDDDVNDSICKTFIKYNYKNIMWECVHDNVRVPVNTIVINSMEMFISNYGYTIKYTSIPTSLKQSILKSLK